MAAAKGKSGAGRPAASSHGALEEAACELALEQGWDHVSASEIARRAGVSRSSFFNYFASKSDVLWWNVDVALASADSLRGFVARLEEIGPPTALTYVDAMGARLAAEDSAAARANRLASLLRQGPRLGAVREAQLESPETATRRAQEPGAGATGAGASVALASGAGVPGAGAGAGATGAGASGAGVPVALAASIQRIRASALASGTIAAVLEWAPAGLGRAHLSDYLDAALGAHW